jgi:flagella basal body P-ring formation protein FlgA
MKSQAVAFLMSLDIDCSNYINGSTAHLDFQWKANVCVERFDKYSNVKLKAIRSVRRELKSSLKTETLSVSNPIGGRVSVSRAWQENGQWVETNIYYKLEIVEDVWVSKRNIDQRRVLTKEDLVVREQNIGTYIGIKIPMIESPVGKYTTKKIGRGKIVFSEDVTVVPLIKKGDSLVVNINSNQINFQVEGFALEDGYLKDDNIKIRLEPTGKILTGLILNDENVYVEI